MPRVFVGVGSNINRDESVRAGVSDLQKHYGELQLSSVYESEAIGFEGDVFYNLVVAFDTEESIEQVVAVLSRIEEAHGRVRGSGRFSSRTLDLDLLLYGDLVARGEGYHVPRDEIPRYAFVLWPLSELAPNMVHPETGETFSDMWEAFDKRNQALVPITFEW
jgi:2-amino-4-hydroxy-6-hydroxymethyldihydropteridine diphosphokinase